MLRSDHDDEIWLLAHSDKGACMAVRASSHNLSCRQITSVTGTGVGAGCGGFSTADLFLSSIVHYSFQLGNCKLRWTGDWAVCWGYWCCGYWFSGYWRGWLTWGLAHSDKSAFLAVWASSHDLSSRQITSITGTGAGCWGLSTADLFLSSVVHNRF